MENQSESKANIEKAENKLEEKEEKEENSKSKPKQITEVDWNPWVGCKKCSSGCTFCSVGDIVTRSATGFNLPIKRMKKRSDYFEVDLGTVINVCPMSDFFIEEADYMRERAWEMIHSRPDVMFKIVTKRPERIRQCLPQNWLAGWNNVMICTSVENQYNADLRIPYLLDLVDYGFKHLGIVLEPMIEWIDIYSYIGSGLIERVEVGGENYRGMLGTPRPFEVQWAKDIRQQCLDFNISFRFKGTGSRFIDRWGDEVAVRFCDQRGLADFYGLTEYTADDSLLCWKYKAEDEDNRRLMESAWQVRQLIEKERLEAEIKESQSNINENGDKE